MEKLELTPEAIKDKIVHMIETTKSEKEINRLAEARKKFSDGKKLREVKQALIAENEVKLKNVPDDVGDIEAYYRIRKNLEDDNVALKNFIFDLDTRFLPELEEAVRDANEKTYDVISQAVYSTKKKLQTEIDVYLGKVNAIKSSYDEAILLLRTDSRFSAVFRMDNLLLLQEFDYSQWPRGFFDRFDASRF
jgi:hypothetical protein